VIDRLRNRFETKVDRSGDHHLWIGSETRDWAGKLKVNGKTGLAPVSWTPDSEPLLWFQEGVPVVDEPVVAGRAGGPAATTQTGPRAMVIAAAGRLVGRGLVLPATVVGKGPRAVGRILQSAGREQHDRRLRGQGDRGWRWRAVDAGVAGRDRECGAADVWLAGDDDPAIEVPADEPTPVVAGT
jgi:hypothetical protein